MGRWEDVSLKSDGLNVVRVPELKKIKLEGTLSFGISLHHKLEIAYPS